MTRLLIAYIITSTPFINPRQTRAKRLRSGLWAAFFRPVLVLVQMDVGWCCIFPQPDVGAWQRPCGVNAVSLSLCVSVSPSRLVHSQPNQCADYCTTTTS